MENNTSTFILKIWRGNPGKQYWEEFELKRAPGMNLISALMEIQKNPVTKEGKKVTPVAWEAGCLEEVCGSCSMLVNGKPRQSCTALVENIIKETGNSTITLAPFSKFPLVRDLITDRSSMFENLKKVHGWIEADNTWDKGHGPKIDQKKQELMYTLSTCMTCGCCVESCPQVNSHSEFMGPQIMGQVRFFNLHPTGAYQKAERLRVLMQEGGISSCGNAQNCVKVCPKNIPLTEAISAIGRAVSLQAFKDMFSGDV
jgi:succinate dehydrogenase / fumarate reductase iron-sulfur subunit